MVIVHSHTIFPKRIAQEVINQFKSATRPSLLAPTTVVGTLRLGNDTLGRPVKIIAAFQRKRIRIQPQDYIHIIGNHCNQVGIE